MKNTKSRAKTKASKTNNSQTKQLTATELKSVVGGNTTVFDPNGFVDYADPFIIFNTRSIDVVVVAGRSVVSSSSEVATSSLA